MTNNKIMHAAITAAWNSFGVIVEKFATDPIAKTYTIYISVPSNSFHKDADGNEMAGELLAKRFYRAVNDMVNNNPYAPKIIVKSRTRQVQWTKEMADKAKEDTLKDFFDPFK